MSGLKTRLGGGGRLLRTRLLSEPATQGWATGPGEGCTRAATRPVKEQSGEPPGRAEHLGPSFPTCSSGRGAPRRSGEVGGRVHRPGSGPRLAGTLGPTWCSAGRDARGHSGNHCSFFKVGGGAGGGQAPPWGPRAEPGGQWGAGGAEPRDRSLKKLVAGASAGTELRRQRRRLADRGGCGGVDAGRATSVTSGPRAAAAQPGIGPGAHPRCASLRVRARCWT